MILEPGLELGFLGNDDFPAFARLVQLLERQQNVERLAGLGVFNAIHDKSIKVGGGEADVTIHGPTDSDRLQDGEMRLATDDFAETGQSLFQVCGG